MKELTNSCLLRAGVGDGVDNVYLQSRYFNKGINL